MTASDPVAFQGAPGAYSEQVIRDRFGDGAATRPCRTFDAVFDAVEGGEAGLGVVPIENSIAGSIARTADLLCERTLHIVGEHYLRVEHCLLGLPGSRASRLKRVISHPQALDQCRAYLDKLEVEREAFFDTAGAAAWVAAAGQPEVGAIAGRLAAARHGLEVLAENIQTHAHNTTRFLSLSKRPRDAGGGPHKTSLVFEARHLPAALYKCLGGFATQGINLTKLESRPSQAEIGRYRFFLDCEGHIDEPALDAALRELAHFALQVRVLGSYPQARPPDGA